MMMHAVVMVQTRESAAVDRNFLETIDSSRRKNANAVVSK